MATQAQIDANRRNAELSTGPKTDEGKEAASKNALKHGLRAAEALAEDEDPAEFHAFAADLLMELRPEGVSQSRLADRIIHAQWKLMRIPRLEREAIHQVTHPTRCITQKPVAGIVEDLTEGVHSKLGALQTYEMRLERTVRKCTKELRDLQAAKKDNDIDRQIGAAYRAGYNRSNYDTTGKFPMAWLLEEDELIDQEEADAINAERRAKRRAELLREMPDDDETKTAERTQFVSNDRPDKELEPEGSGAASDWKEDDAAEPHPGMSAIAEKAPA